MSKNVEVVYAAPWKGLNNSSPDIYLDPSESPALSNIWLRNMEIQSAPNFAFAFVGPEPNNPSLGQVSFMDANATIHTCAFTTRGMFQLGSNNATPSGNPWSSVGGLALNPGVPVSARSFANLLYWTNGSPYLQSWDGIASASLLVSGLTSSIFGGVGSSIGGVYLYELNDQLCLLNVSILNAASTGSTPAGSVTNLPQRLWYSANGVPNQFDPTVNISAGFVDFLDVPDIFTGVMALGEVAYMFRTNGITEQTITGNPLAPFYFDHLWASEQGIGNVYPWSIAQYGSSGFFVSTEDIYSASVYKFDPIGGKAREAIMRDLSRAILNPVANVIPSQSYGFIYVCYELCIPLQGFTRIYRYSTEDHNWMQHDLTGYQITGRPSPCWV